MTRPTPPPTPTDVSPGFRALLVLLAVATAIVAAPAALACMCVEPGPPEQALEQADAVFTARVVAAERVEVDTGHGMLPRLRVELEPRKAWKGLEAEEAGEDAAGRVVLHTGLGGGDCGFGFEEGRDYLVYAYRGGDGVWVTDICSRTRRLEQADADLAALGEPARRWRKKG